MQAWSKYRVDQHLYSISIDKILVTEFITVKILQNLNSMQKKCQHNVCQNQTLESIQSIRKQIDYKKLLNTKQVHRVQNIQIKAWKYKTV